MAEIDAMNTQEALVEAALRLVDDYPDIAAGSVLRCYARAVRVVQQAHTPLSHVPIQAEILASQLLAARNGPGMWGPQVLRPDSSAVPTRAAGGYRPRALSEVAR
jgi:hypothetical protein